MASDSATRSTSAKRNQARRAASSASYSQVMRKLFESVREYRGYAIATPILVLGEVIFEVLVPFRTAELVNAIKASAELSEVLEVGGELAIMAIISLVFGAAAGVTCSKASCGFAKNLRHDMFENIQTFSFGVIDDFSTSSLVTRLTTDVTNVQQAFMLIIRTAVRSPFMLVFALIAAFILGGSLAFVFVIVLPILAVVLFVIVRKVGPIFKRIFKKYDALNETAEENLSGIRVVKSYVREDYEKEQFENAAEDVRKDFTHVERILALNTPIMNFCVYVLFVVLIYAGSYLIIDSMGTSLDVGQFSSLIEYGFMTLQSLMMFSMILSQLTMAEEGARRIYEVLIAKTTIEEPEDPVYEVQDGSVDFDHVSFSYSDDPTHLALEDIDLHIQSGEVIGVIGGTGSGKSSLVQLIARLYDTTDGSVSVGGVDVRDYDLDTLRGQVAMVLQNNVLFSGTVAENLRWGNPNATDEQIREAARIAQADEFIQALPDGYDTQLEEGGTNVSGGQKQRLCIARALLKNPKVLILDDSTSAVDTKTDRLIREGLKSCLPDTTKFIIAQRTSSVEDADRIVVLDNGQLNDVGTHEELLRRNAIYREVYLSQNKKSHDERRLTSLEVEDDVH